MHMGSNRCVSQYSENAMPLATSVTKPLKAVPILAYSKVVPGAVVKKCDGS